jgi:hypothetical protein
LKKLPSYLNEMKSWRTYQFWHKVNSLWSIIKRNLIIKSCIKNNKRSLFFGKFLSEITC